MAKLYASYWSFWASRWGFATLSTETIITASSGFSSRIALKTLFEPVFFAQGIDSGKYFFQMLTSPKTVCGARAACAKCSTRMALLLRFHSKTCFGAILGRLGVWLVTFCNLFCVGDFIPLLDNDVFEPKPPLEAHIGAQNCGRELFLFWKRCRKNDVCRTGICWCSPWGALAVCWSVLGVCLGRPGALLASPEGLGRGKRPDVGCAERKRVRRVGVGASLEGGSTDNMSQSDRPRHSRPGVTMELPRAAPPRSGSICTFISICMMHSCRCFYDSIPVLRRKNLVPSRTTARMLTRICAVPAHRWGHALSQSNRSGILQLQGGALRVQRAPCDPNLKGPPTIRKPDEDVRCGYGQLRDEKYKDARRWRICHLLNGSNIWS